MSRKPILIVKDDPEAKVVVDAICAVKHDAEAAISAIKDEAMARIKVLEDKANGDCQPHWKALAKRLVALGKTTKDDPSISINEAEGVVYELTGEDCECEACRAKKAITHSLKDGSMLVGRLPKEVEEALGGIFSMLPRRPRREDEDSNESVAFGRPKSNVVH